jgi:hypothetical protein
LTSLIGGGRTRLQPIFVEDVAEAVASILTDPGTVGRTYELAGPGVYTLRELVRMTLRLMGKRRLVMPLPFAVAEIQARLLELLPNPPLTTGQVDLLKAENVACGNLPGLQELKIHPKKRSRRCCRRISALGQKDLSDWGRSEIDHPPALAFFLRGFRRPRPARRLRVRIQGCPRLVIHPTLPPHTAARHGRRARILLRPFGNHRFCCHQEASDRTRIL